MNDDLKIRDTIIECQQVICRGDCFIAYLRIRLDVKNMCVACNVNKVMTRLKQKDTIDSSVEYRLYG